LEGITVTVTEDEDFSDCKGAPFINLSFWEFSNKYNGSKLTLTQRIRYAIHILRGKSPWADMVVMTSSTAKNFANHIMYLISKSSERGDKSKPLVEWPLKK
jgi:hypothetical protein